MLHSALLPTHTRWRGFFTRRRVVLIAECHNYRGVFGSHVAQVLRRLRRVAAQHKPEDGQMAPVFVLASATIAEPAAGARLLTGLDVIAVTEDGSPRVPLTFALWEPPLMYTRGDVRVPPRGHRGGGGPAGRAGQVGGARAGLHQVPARRGKPSRSPRAPPSAEIKATWSRRTGRATWPTTAAT